MLGWSLDLGEATVPSGKKPAWIQYSATVYSFPGVPSGAWVQVLALPPQLSDTVKVLSQAQTQCFCLQNVHKHTQANCLAWLTVEKGGQESGAQTPAG